MPREYRIVPMRVPLMNTPFRRIQTEIPAPGSVPVLEKLMRYERLARRGLSPTV